MNYPVEESDILNAAVECFEFEAAKEKFPVLHHWHYFMEIIFMKRGNAFVYADNRKYLLKEGDMILFFPKCVHAVFASDENLLVYTVMKFDINTLKITPHYAPKLRSIFRYAQRSGMEQYFPKEIASKIRAESIFSDCLHEITSQNYGFDLAIQLQIYQLLLGVVRQWNQNGFYVGNEVFSEDEKYDILNITDYIEENLGADLSVTDIAKKCGLSYSYFAKRFMEIYGRTCKEYIEYTRILKVEELLNFTDFDLNYISQETGFADCSHMIKSFKRFRNDTPKQYRLKHKNKEF